MGSWKIMAISPPRMARISRPVGASWVISTTVPSLRRNWMEESGWMTAVPGRRRMMAWVLTLLPEPLSPTMPRVRPVWAVRSTPSTAWICPSSVRKAMRRFSTLSRAPSRLVPFILVSLVPMLFLMSRSPCTDPPRPARRPPGW